ncbi:MAG: YeeE/YedE thiosulfate transporter family protein, partial [Cyanobacteria bacterium P01_H01_bin.15]
RIAGISGIISGSLPRSDDAQWRWLFLVGMILGGILYEYVLTGSPTPKPSVGILPMVLGGGLVGFGTRLGNGCTSGHGVCGLGRLSMRSLAAVITFLSTAMVTVFISRHLLILG